MDDEVQLRLARIVELRNIEARTTAESDELLNLLVDQLPKPSVGQQDRGASG